MAEELVILDGVASEPPVSLDVLIVEPIELDGSATSAGATFGIGAKETGVDAGELWQLSLTDDYIYVCVTAGVIGVAVWKKALMFVT